MSSPASTDIGSVQSNVFSDNNSCSPASSIEYTSPHHKTAANGSSGACCASESRLRPQCKSMFAEALVDSAALILETVWPCSTDSTCYIRQALSLKRFIQETLRRSRTIYSTLQLALYYIIQIKKHIYDQRAHNRRIGNVVKRGDKLGLRCGRRAFLSALMIASKYMQDRNYSVRAWSMISGLPVPELCENEQLFLGAMGWNAHIKYPVYERWSGVLLECACDYSPAKAQVWEERFRTLDPSITGVESWKCSSRPTICQTEAKATAANAATAVVPVQSPALTSANLKNLSGGATKRKSMDEDTAVPETPCKRATVAGKTANAQSRVHEWTVCVATHLPQGNGDPMSAAV